MQMFNTWRFIMFSVITNIYKKKAKGPTLMELFTARITATVKIIDAPMFTRVWQEHEYRIDVCCVTHSVHIEHLSLSTKLFQSSCDCEQFH
jgi:hypothetical protein